ncbi:bifunctional phosphopantothenoylcysteine decarboxylase/phosphopantothenate synthase [Planctomonas psychrotolerans]|uniref:bifunctional phosphopantothenoylcysteine decarboxylase/phosphopantothenate synthase n=1 Tax=Planctomonas psychrotolerans TaxID=2528712 RepID=UPI00123C32C6|nr:bifunctional phosphopantothenoylcysteine decarboxylase/phosphopantothenate synthase [Planctomonas psychrotolerans]
MTNPERLTVVVGISGGIAAYKAVGVVRGLVLAGHDVHVVATDAALRFVGRPTLEAISRNIVHSDLYEGVAQVRHVAIGQSADLIVIAPATANTLAKLATGLADDLLGTTVLASTAPVIVAPAMHTEMWQNAATVANVATLRSRGIAFVGPESGQLTGSDSGPGRMAEPDAIVAAALALVPGAPAAEGAPGADPGPAVDGAPGADPDLPTRHDLAGVRLLVSAGGTREPLDPVRFLGNRSSGKQGVALAVAARDRGAEVTLLAAHLEVPAPEGVDVVQVETAKQLAQAAAEYAQDSDVIIMAAAVADYRPASIAQTKLKKDAIGDTMTLELVKNPDILASLAANRRADQVVIGFAAETAGDTAELLRVGREKLERKGCDFLVLNRVGWLRGFAVDDNAVVVVSRGGDIVMEASGSKAAVADRILDVLRPSGS